MEIVDGEMVRGWLAVLAILVGVEVSLAADSSSPLLNEKRWEEARKSLASGNPAEAKTAFEELLKKYPQEADLHLFLGITLLRLRELHAAEAAVKRALAVDPNHVEARTLLGWIDSDIHGDFDSAIKEYSKVVELRPDLAEAYNNLGVAQKRKGELNKAAESFNKALERRPDFTPALSNRGWIFAEQNKWAEARQDFEQALKLSPHDDGALYGLSQSLRETRDYAGAQKALSQLMSRSPNFVYWLEWGRIGLIRYWWVLLLTAAAFFLKGRFQKVRNEPHGS
ncbi:MAG TPA: tetratricopeptide repeat protein [Candidatus Udaeobacter sp.]|nr:tetratricopeptide repeat protein [Candidatus Udaeobacter sp.]